AFARHALDPDRAAHRLHQLADDPQPQAEAPEVAHVHRPLEALEDAALVAGRNADSPVHDADTRGLRIRGELHRHRLTCPEFDGVGEQVADHLIDTQAIPLTDHGPLAAEAQRDPLLAGVLLAALDDVANHLGEVDRLRLEHQAPPRDAGDVEQARHQTLQAHHPPVDDLQLLTALLRRGGSRARTNPPHQSPTVQ